MNNIIEEFWINFLKDTKRNEDLKYFECFHFDLTENSANYLLELVLSGKKRATASSLLAYQSDNATAPKVGDMSIVTDWNGVPRCVIETTSITILPFKDITFDICKREGEDETLESWQNNHVKFFTEEGKMLSYQFSWDMSVIFEDFQVIYQI